MKIDEEKEYSVMNLAQLKKNKRIIETDHNAMILDLKMRGKGKSMREKR